MDSRGLELRLRRHHLWRNGSPDAMTGVQDPVAIDGKFGPERPPAPAARREQLTVELGRWTLTACEL